MLTRSFTKVNLALKYGRRAIAQKHKWEALAIAPPIRLPATNFISLMPRAHSGGRYAVERYVGRDVVMGHDVLHMVRVAVDVVAVIAAARVQPL